jgi:predicted ATPase/class 3 adenylate cyclase
MECTACGRANRAGRKFCAGCGAPLLRICAVCAALNEPDARFCGDCGADLDAAADSAPSPVPTDTSLTPAAPREGAAAAGERRQLTVMFCDLVDSTHLANRLDPEEYRELLRAYQQTAADVVGRFAGTIAHYMGDGLLVYFGYPRAYGDDARRAVQAGLELVRAMATLNEGLHRERQIAVRVGIHTGLVVVGEMGAGAARQMMDVVGETPNIAARLQTLAASDTVLISADTLRLVEGFFAHEALGAQALKGVDRPLAVYRVVGEAPAQTRLEVAGAGLTTLIGREDEVRALRARWAEILTGAARVVLLCGEAGIGKSRLLHVMKEHAAAGDDHLCIELRCSPYHQSSALYPIIDYVQRALGIQSDDGPGERLARLEALLVRDGLPPAEFVPLVARLLSIPLDGRYPAPELAPEVERQRTLAAVLTWLQRLCERRPVLLTVEDLHWIDPSTLELLTMIVEGEPVARLLALLSYRPEFTPPWPLHRHFSLLTLTRLDGAQIRQMIAHLTGGRPLPEDLRQQVVARTDGVPLFVEELTRTLLETGLVQEEGDAYVLAGPLPAVEIPTTLHDSLMARLDRLSAVKEVAQLGATIGREFSYRMLCAVAHLDEQAVQHSLAQLVQADVLQERGVAPNRRYVFRHALIQEAAYSSLLKSRRQQFHQRIAQALEEQFPETVETQPELVARHFTEAQRAAQAVPSWLRAGQRAVERSANREAIDHLTNGLALLPGISEANDRNQVELALQMALGAAHMAAGGPGAPQLERAYARARELCGALDENRHLFAALRGLCSFYLARADYAAAREIARQMLAIAEQAQHPTLLLGAHNVLREVTYFVGDLERARLHCERALSYYDPERHRPRGARAGQDPAIAALAYLALALGLLGHADEARRRMNAALNRAGELDHPHSTAYAHAYAAYLYDLLREGATAEAHARTAIAISEQYGFGMWRASGAWLLGAALAEQGSLGEGLARLLDGMSAWRDISAEVNRSFPLGCTIEAYRRAGQVDTGLALADEALAFIARTGERYYEAEIVRLRGELLVTGAPARATEAEADFRRALDIAHRQGARLLELRAAMSLHRLGRREGFGGRSPGELAAVYASFTEGFDTPDLQDAAALLALDREAGRV